MTSALLSVIETNDLLVSSSKVVVKAVLNSPNEANDQVASSGKVVVKAILSDPTAALAAIIPLASPTNYDEIIASLNQSVIQDNLILAILSNDDTLSSAAKLKVTATVVDPYSLLFSGVISLAPFSTYSDLVAAANQIAFQDQLLASIVAGEDRLSSTAKAPIHATLSDPDALLGAMAPLSAFSTFDDMILTARQVALQENLIASLIANEDTLVSTAIAPIHAVVTDPALTLNAIGTLPVVTFDDMIAALNQIIIKDNLMAAIVANEDTLVSSSQLIIKATVVDPAVALAAIGSSPSISTFDDLIANANQMALRDTLLLSLLANEDFVSSTSVLKLKGSLILSEQNDAPATSGKLGAKGAVNFNEDNDLVSSVSKLKIKASFIYDPLADLATSLGIVISPTSLEEIISSSNFVDSQLYLAIKALSNNDYVITSSTLALKSQTIITEVDDTVVISSKIIDKALLGGTEASDILMGRAKVIVKAIAGSSENNDTVVSQAKRVIRAPIIYNETNDQLLAQSVLKLRGIVRPREENDTLTLGIQLLVSSSVNITEKPDTLKTQVSTRITAQVSITELDDEVFEHTGRLRRVVLNNIYSTPPRIY